MITKWSLIAAEIFTLRVNYASVKIVSLIYAK